MRLALFASLDIFSRSPFSYIFQREQGRKLSEVYACLVQHTLLAAATVHLESDPIRLSFHVINGGRCLCGGQQVAPDFSLVGDKGLYVSVAVL